MNRRLHEIISEDQTSPMGSSIRLVAISMYSSMQAHLEAVDSFQHPVRIHQTIIFQIALNFQVSAPMKTPTTPKTPVTPTPVSPPERVSTGSIQRMTRQSRSPRRSELGRGRSPPPVEAPPQVRGWMEKHHWEVFIICIYIYFFYHCLFHTHTFAYMK